MNYRVRIYMMDGTNENLNGKDFDLPIPPQEKMQIRIGELIIVINEIRVNTNLPKSYSPLEVFCKSLVRKK